MNDGRSLQAYKRGESSETLQLFDLAKQQTTSLAKAEIEDQREVGTLMPDGLAAAMTPEQRRDLVRFLQRTGTYDPGWKTKFGRRERLQNSTMTARRSIRMLGRCGNMPVNRDRVYDFYAKEAIFFRNKPHAHLLPAFPGLDGGKFGHWGNQNEDVWKDDRWNRTDLGTVLAGVFHGPGVVVPKGVCVRLGEHGEMATCFNPETLTYEALWQGGFLKFSDVRHGFMDGLSSGRRNVADARGRTSCAAVRLSRFLSPGPARCIRLSNRRCRNARLALGEGRIPSSVLSRRRQNIRCEMRSRRSAQWPQELKTSAQLGSGHPYAVDTIQLPFDNPWNSLLFVGDHDFLPDGSALVCTMQGDVWRVTGLDHELKDVRWRRFASGLHQPLGLVVSEGQVYVLGRDQITRLHDLNGDGEADFYECFSNKLLTSPAGHDFTCGLARDPQGRFYTASGKQGLLRISANGEQIEVLATGLRNPDGVALQPDGAITLPCSEGDWTPASMICLVPREAAAASRYTSVTAASARISRRRCRSPIFRVVSTTAAAAR